MERKRILIYGDSNTHGFRVSDGLRYRADARWAGICQELTAEWAEILEEGLNGRTTCINDPGMEFRNGLSYIEACIRTHLPLDMVCVMLGSNDLKESFRRMPEDIAKGSAAVLQKARDVADSKYPGNTCKYVLISPPEVTEEVVSGPFGWDFEGMETVRKSRMFSALFAKQAEKHNFLFFDAAAVCRPGKIDGLHLDKENHRRLGEAFGAWLNEQRLL